MLENVFVADARFEGQGEANRLLTVWARSGKLVQEDGISYLLLTDGFQYQGKPGQRDYKEIGFKEARCGSVVKIGQSPTQSARPVDQRIDRRA